MCTYLCLIWEPRLKEHLCRWPIQWRISKEFIHNFLISIKVKSISSHDFPLALTFLSPCSNNTQPPLCAMVVVVDSEQLQHLYIIDSILHNSVVLVPGIAEKKRINLIRCRSTLSRSNRSMKRFVSFPKLP